MTKQWHNTKIPQKPCNRYNPSLQQAVSSTYRPWYILVAILACLFGIALIGCAAETKVLSSDVSDEVFHLWIGIPLVFLGLFSLACFIMKKKKLVVCFLIVALIVMVICAVGALVAGVRYWMDGWQFSRRLLEDDKCAPSNNKCLCTGQEAKMPVSVDDCGNLKTLVYLIIAEIALSAGGFVASTIGVFLSFMTICCGPWTYMEWYDENEDPDFNPQDAVKHVSGNVNASYGGANNNPYSKSAY